MLVKKLKFYNVNNYRLGANVNVFGNGAGGNYERCPQNWRNTSSTVNSSGLKKFESKSYGVPTAGSSSLADWAISVNINWNEFRTVDFMGW